MKDGPGSPMKRRENLLVITGNLLKLKLNNTVLRTLRNPLDYKLGNRYVRDINKMSFTIWFTIREIRFEFQPHSLSFCVVVCNVSTLTF